MGRILMLPKESTYTETDKAFVDNISLPLFYMSDYSVMAIRVNRFEVAQSQLEKERFHFNRVPEGVEVVIDDFAQLKTILQVFATHGINAELTDIAAQIYQG